MCFLFGSSSLSSLETNEKRINLCFWVITIKSISLVLETGVFSILQRGMAEQLRFALLDNREGGNPSSQPPT